jgi:membrane-bound ClpP family serine protease
MTADLADVNYDQVKPRNRNTPGVFVLPLNGTVGVEFRHEEMERIAEEADKYGSGQIIVLLIDSGGGLVTEMEQIHSTLTEIKKRHRLVAWVRQAISAACATAVHCHEIYFMKNGTAGAMTAYNGGTGEAWSGPELERWMQHAGDWMESGGRSRYIAEAMIHAPNMLSYDKDSVTGEVTFYNDLSGEIVLSRSGENLVFTASNALDSGFSDGTASNEEALAELLDLPEWYETSDYGRKIAKQWQDTVESAERELPLLMKRLEYAGTGSGNPVEILGTRIRIYEKFMRWHERCPNCTMIAGLPPKDQLKREIVEMRRDLAKLKKR